MRTDTAPLLNLCVSLFAAAEQDFVAYVTFVKQLITDPDKHLTREEKVTQPFTFTQQEAAKCLLPVVSRLLCSWCVLSRLTNPPLKY